MKSSLTVTIRRVDNGFTVVSQQPGVPNAGGNKIATNEADAEKIAAEIIHNALQPEPPKG